MLEARAHHQLKALLRQAGEPRWPHHLTLSRLVARSLRRAGITSLNADLVYGLPFQTPEKLAVTIAKVCAASVSVAVSKSLVLNWHLLASPLPN